MKPKYCLLISLVGLALLSCGSVSSAPLSTSSQNAESSVPAPSSTQAASSEESSPLSEESSSSPSSESLPASSSSQAPSSSELSSEPMSSISSSEGEIVTEEGIQGSAILHAFNWSMDAIKGELKSIKEAGYDTVQISPLQPQKDPYSGYWRGQWWKLYQPLGFKVADAGQNVLGDRNSLKSLTAEAKKHDIKIIVDVVTNHLAGGDRNSLNGNVNNFESEIYSNNLIHQLNKYADDADLQSIVQGNIGDYPDLKTEDSRVQSRVVSMLKEYIDCGVSGFRFDAAKHIETPDDGDYASSYWPTVTQEAYDYSELKTGERCYIYGEILYKPGDMREWSSYEKYMSSIDSSQGYDVLSAITGRKPGKAIGDYSGLSPDHLVLWAESHDTYSNDSHETTNISVDDINKAYAIQASRKQASTLYLARPDGDMGNIGSSDYKSPFVAAANKFHNLFRGAEEDLSISQGYFVNVRCNGPLHGAMIVNINGSKDATVTVPLPDGAYTDLYSKKNYIVSNGVVTGSFGDAVMLCNSNVTPGEVEVGLSCSAPAFVEKTTVTAVSSGQTSSYQIGNETPVSFSGSVTFDVGAGLGNGDVTVKVTGKSGNTTKSSSILLTKTPLAAKNFVIYHAPKDVSVLLWAWNSDADGHFEALEQEGSVLAKDYSAKNYIFVTFPLGTNASTANWNNKIAQSGDLVFTERIYQDYETISWK